MEHRTQNTQINSLSYKYIQMHSIELKTSIILISKTCLIEWKVVAALMVFGAGTSEVSTTTC